jgi:hypothetical protein
MGPEPGVYKRVLLCISDIVIEKDMKIIYGEVSKISKYDVSFCVYTYALYLYNTSLWFIIST